MNKNPFVPQPSYTPQQPPLPPGPPPPQPAQPDYTAYWAAAAAAQQAQAPHIQPALGAYNPQWNAAPPPRPPAEQSALYANYGYGNQQSNWQRQQQQQQQQQQQHYPPPPPPMVPQPPQAQPGYNPYQPTAGYPQPYIPQAGPQPVAQPAFPPPQPQQPFYMQQQQHIQQQHQQHQNRPIHHTPPQHLPPAKRQRFDGPNSNQQRQAPPPQPQFSAPPPPPSVGGGYSGPGHGQGSRGGAPIGGMGGRGGSNAQRGGGGGGGGARGGRAGSMAGGRGGMNNRGGRGASMGSIGGQNRGGSSGQLRGHGSRGNFGGNKDFHNRRTGGQFGGFNHQNQNSSFRGRGSQNHPNRGSRHDGGGNASSNYGPRDTPMSSSYGSASKKDENRRTLTDFKIVGLEIHDLSWEWGIVSSTPPAKAEIMDESLEGQVPSEADKEERRTSEIPMGSDTAMINPEQVDPSAPVDVAPVTKEPTDPPIQPAADAASAVPASTSCPPSRIRIYFHTPVTPDDSKPIPHNSSSYSVASDSGRKGKRKKLEDDDGDIEEGRAPPPPPQMASGAGDDHSSVAASVAPSVAETSSEADWLMAAIAEGEGEGEHTQAATEIEGEIGPGDDGDDDDEYGEHLHVSQIVEADAPAYDDMLDTHGQIGDTDGSGNAAVDDHAAHPSSSSGDGHEHDGSVVGDGHTGMAVSSENQAGEEPSVEMEAPEAPSADAKLVDNDPAAAIAEGNAPVVTEGQGPAGHDVPSVASLSDDAKSAAAVHASTEQVTDNIGSHDDQISDNPHAGKSLQAVSAEPTLLDIPDDGEASQESSTVINGGESLQDAQPEHLPEPPASPASNTLSASTLGDSSSQSPSKPDPKGTRTPSANRLSISYAGGNRRLVIDAEIVDKLQLFRQDGRIEVILNVEKDKDSDQSLKGIIVEGLSEKSSYTPLPTLDDAPDVTVPPFNKAQIPSKITLMVHLDTSRPLSEPKWARSGDIQEWLKSMFGRMFWVAGDAAEGWEKKIIVVDPDPPPTIWTVLEGWAVNSPAGMSSERQRFLKTHMTDPDNVLEILLRLVRGERATPFSQSGQSISPPSVSGPLLSASQGSAHGAQQTHVSLAVLAIFRMSAEYAMKALGDKGKEEVESRVGEIIRCLPSHLIYKSLDGIFKEWRVEKKGR
ncbi:hypothetical protein EYR40_005559 [Pleurotus pulmonarius]|nr:hypothetical protein EYR40_005559 [Pleurotus pulmonarius]